MQFGKLRRSEFGPAELGDLSVCPEKVSGVGARSRRLYRLVGNLPGSFGDGSGCDVNNKAVDLGTVVLWILDWRGISGIN